MNRLLLGFVLLNALAGGVVLAVCLGRAYWQEWRKGRASTDIEGPK